MDKQYDEIMKELERIEKSEPENQEEELDKLTKALEADLKGDDNEEADDKDKQGGEPAGDDEGDPAEPGEDLGKSMDEDMESELIKASEAYADLTKSVEDGIGGLHDELELMQKSMAALMNLNIKQAKVIAEMVKSRKDDTEAISKSLESIAGRPVAPVSAKIGIAGSSETPLAKSSSEIHDALLKAVQEGKIQAQYLSMYGTYRNVDVLPEDVKQIIGC